jgi:hypothetical protein
MKLSILHSYLKDENLYLDLIIEADKEVKEFTRLSGKKGSSIPVILDEDVKSVTVGKNELRTVCTSFLEGHLDKYFVSYIADALSLSERVSFDNEAIREFFEEMTDPEINGELTKERVMEILIASA